MGQGRKAGNQASYNDGEGMQQGHASVPELEELESYFTTILFIFRHPISYVCLTCLWATAPYPCGPGCRWLPACATLGVAQGGVVWGALMVAVTISMYISQMRQGV